MDALVSVLLSLRSGSRRALPIVGAALLASVVALHAAQPQQPWLFTTFVLMLLGLIAARAWKRTHAVTQNAWLDVEIGVLLMVAAYAVAVHVDRSLDGRFYALVYVAIAVMSAFARPGASLAVIGLMITFEAGLRVLAYDHVDPEKLLPHLGFAVVFGVLNTLSLRMEVARLRRASHTELEAERDRIRDDARSYRLLRAPNVGGSGSSSDEERLLRSGVQEIELAVLFALRLLRSCLGVHTAMLLWQDGTTSRLRISELVSDDADISDGPFSARDGILAAVTTQAKPVRLGDLKPSYLLPHYSGTCPVKAVCAVPVFEHGSLRGVLVVDSKQRRAFDDDDLALVEQAARFVARAIENERVFVQLERTKVEQEKLYRAAERLGAAISEEDVVHAGVGAASDIASVDFAAVTAFDPVSGAHQIRACVGDEGETLVGARFEHNRGLVSAALTSRHPLPYRGDYDAGHQVVFTKRLAPPVMPSLLVLPLVVHDVPLGTLVLGSRVAGAFHEAARNLLEVLASHLAVSLSHARMVKQLEERATTDGLTGLLNKRAMLDSADDKLRAAKRFGRRLSVLIVDIDHFKVVNDTYGHDTGDTVIQGLAAIHRRNKRNTDAVARFGGEEFVTICDETDAEGALLLAERIRTELEKSSFHAGTATLQCTCSVGIATYPEAGDRWEGLFRAADAALYASKRGGRNKTTVFVPGEHDIVAA